MLESAITSSGDNIDLAFFTQNKKYLQNIVFLSVMVL